jgi:hypothetical protein
MWNAALTTSMPERRRQAGLTLPQDPSEEELARDWALSEADRVEVLRCRGDDTRRRFALQLCVVSELTAGSRALGGSSLRGTWSFFLYSGVLVGSCYISLGDS